MYEWRITLESILHTFPEGDTALKKLNSSSIDFDITQTEPSSETACEVTTQDGGLGIPRHLQPCKTALEQTYQAESPRSRLMGFQHPAARYFSKPLDHLSWCFFVNFLQLQDQGNILCCTLWKHKHLSLWLNNLNFQSIGSFRSEISH